MKDHIFVERVIEAGADQAGGDIAEQEPPGPVPGCCGEQQEQAIIQRKTEQGAGCEFTGCRASGNERFDHGGYLLF